MTSAIQEAIRLELLREGAEPLDFGFVIATTSARLGWRGTIDVVGRGVVLPAETVSFMRDRLINEARETPVDRYRITRADGVTIEGPFGLETFASRQKPAPAAGFELVITSEGDQVESGERDPAEEAKRAEARVVVMGEGATDAVRQVALTLIETRPPEVPLDDALSAVLAGGLTGLVMTMIAADPTAKPEQIEKALLEGVSSIIGVMKNGR